MRRLTLAVLAVAMGLGAAPAQGAVTCRSGFAVHESPGVRFFIAYAKKSDTEAGLYACTERIRRPKLIYRNSPATTPSIGVERRFGTRIVLDIEEFADGGNGVWAGWFDVRTGQYLETTVRNPRRPADPEMDNENWTQRTVGLVAGPTGSLAWAMHTEGGGYELFVAARSGRKLARARSVAEMAGDEFDPETLRFEDGLLTWRTKGAETRSALAAPAAPGSGRRLRPVRGLSCLAPSGIHLDARMRFFTRRDEIFGCVEDRRGARPVQVAGAGSRLDLITRSGVVEGFLIRGTGRPVIATFDTRDDRLRRRTLPAGPYGGRPEIPTLAPRSDGAIALLERDATDRIVYLAPRGAGFEAPVVVATLPRGQVEGHTLRLTRAGVSWRATGQPRSAPDS